jgi:hypothetical protein
MLELEQNWLVRAREFRALANGMRSQQVLQPCRMGECMACMHACCTHLPPAARSTLDPPENVGFVPGPPPVLSPTGWLRSTVTEL